MHRKHPAAHGMPLPCTGARLRKLTRRMTSFYEQHMRATGLKLTQYSVLMHLGREPQTLLDLAARLEMDRTTLTRSLSVLADKGWVAEVAGTDLRQRNLVLTPDGQRFRAEAERAWARAQLALEAQLGRDLVADLNDRLEHALDQLKPALAEDN